MVEQKTVVSVYVIMPFSRTTEAHTADYWNEHFADFIKGRLVEATLADPGLSSFDWQVERSSTARGGPLNYEIVWDLLSANVVIADLTDLNPNVLYELGIRHALNAAVGSGRTIMIQDETSFRLPFDFANYAALKYHKDKVDTWKKELSERLRNCIAGYQYRDNPVSMTFAQHGFSFQQQSPQQQQMTDLKAALDAVERMKDLGFDVKWIQDLIGQSIFQNKGGGSGSGIAGSP